MYYKYYTVSIQSITNTFLVDILYVWKPISATYSPAAAALSELQEAGHRGHSPVKDLHLGAIRTSPFLSEERTDNKLPVLEPRRRGTAADLRGLQKKASTSWHGYNVTTSSACARMPLS